ncbi:hypothetical protein [Candidatus Similichlamydia laticola]|uniref:Uncharacterized protein n=1 Tax=Candidatus Similichlamydia laticola TaxID=2170265 RepID=A0A369KJF2_9BACT|nr:hypothetical protein [Candidatus Similichlamydia laticola]RDB31884.1 hypothetical protein HAT2_00004 [Candidatus Similichlamydia laticola]
MQSGRTEGQDFRVDVREGPAGTYQTVVEVQTEAGFERLIMRIRLDGEELDQGVLQLLYDYIHNRDGLTREEILEAHMKMKAISQNVARIFRRRVPAIRASGMRGLLFSASRINEIPQHHRGIRTTFTRLFGTGERGNVEQEQSLIVKKASRDLYNALRTRTRSSISLSRGSSRFVTRRPRTFVSTEGIRTSARAGIPPLELPEESSSSSSELQDAAKGVSHTLSSLLGEVKTSLSSDEEWTPASSKQAFHQAAAATTQALSHLISSVLSGSSSEKERVEVSQRDTRPKQPTGPTMDRTRAWVEESVRRTLRRNTSGRRSAQNVLTEGLLAFQEVMKSDTESSGEETEHPQEGARHRLSVDLQIPFAALELDPDLAAAAASAVQPGQRVEAALAEVAMKNVLTAEDITSFEEQLKRLAEIEDGEDTSSEGMTDRGSVDGVAQQAVFAGQEAEGTSATLTSDETETVSTMSSASSRVGITGRETLAVRAREFIHLNRLQESASARLQSVPADVGPTPLSPLHMVPHEWGNYVGRAVRRTLVAGQIPQVIIPNEGVDASSPVLTAFLDNLFKTWGHKEGYIMTAVGPEGNQQLFFFRRRRQVLGIGPGPRLTPVREIPEGSALPILLLSDQANYKVSDQPLRLGDPVAQYWVSTLGGSAPRLDDLVAGMVTALGSSSSSYALGLEDHRTLVLRGRSRNVSSMMVEQSAQTASTVASLLLGAIELLNVGDGQTVRQEAERLTRDPGAFLNESGTREAVAAEIQSLLMMNIGRPGEEIFSHMSRTPALHLLLQRLAPRQGENQAVRQVVQEFIWPFAVGHVTASSVFLRYLQREMNGMSATV